MNPNSQYVTLTDAYNIMNGALFGGELPACIITLHGSNPRMHGYFHGEIFGNLQNGRLRADEICLNPSLFRFLEQKDVLSILLHEMAHLWQYHHGEPSRNGYHNKEWGAKMKEIGLYPSNTSAPGGKETGQQMSHYVIEGGPFDQLYATMKSNGIQLEWGKDDLILTKTRKNKVKYTCPGCGNNAWGKPGMTLLCEHEDKEIYQMETE